MTLTIPERMLLREWPNPWPKIDFGGCVLYAPLWRPDMQARGGRIVNGTGICTGSPLHLAVAANTVTVTQAGTFTVHMPEGGTVASGTMTVTGSPVTISAGIATTITTTGATGNITVTPSNIIRSKDSANQALTVTGATWTPQGRSFDGIDDNIKLSVADFQGSDQTGAIICWVKVTTGGGNMFVSSSDEATQVNRLWIGLSSVGGIQMLQRANDAQDRVETTTDLRDSKWHHIVWGSNGTSWVCYVDNILQTLAVQSGANTGDWFADTPNRDNLVIGAVVDSGGTTLTVHGLMGDVLVYNRFPSVLELTNLFLQTKWRYV